MHGGNSRHIPIRPRYAARVVNLKRHEYPRSNAYDAEWLLNADMGPHPLWLLEDLAKDLDLRPGMRVLDLGSGKGATSVFLAKEYGVQVWAADLWIDPTEAAANIESQGVDGVVTVKAEAHTLPFAHGFFDAIVCIDAYEYFGTADGYLAYLVDFLKPGGRLGGARLAHGRLVAVPVGDHRTRRGDRGPAAGVRLAGLADVVTGPLGAPRHPRRRARHARGRPGRVPDLRDARRPQTSSLSVAR